MSNIGMIILAIWLILWGVIPLLRIQIPSKDIIMAILSIAAGVLLLLDQRKKRVIGNFGMLLVSIWLLALGIIEILRISFPAENTVMALLAIAAGILLLLKR